MGNNFIRAMPLELLKKKKALQTIDSWMFNETVYTKK